MSCRTMLGGRVWQMRYQRAFFAGKSLTGRAHVTRIEIKGDGGLQAEYLYARGSTHFGWPEPREV